MNNLFNQLDTTSWAAYKRSLGQGVETAQDLGISERALTTFAASFGEFLARNAEADLPENKAIKEMWQLADSRDQKVLAGLMVKLAKKAYKEGN